jgi:putative transposase
MKIERLRTIRCKLEPRPGALQKIRQVAGSRRYVYNRLLAEREAAWTTLGPSPTADAKKAFNRDWSYEGMARRITAWRQELDWLGACPVHALQNAARDLQTAYDRWWKGLAGHPRFKKKTHVSDSWRESDVQCFDLNGQAVKLPRIGWVRARISSRTRGQRLMVTIRQEADGWYAGITYREETEAPKPVAGPPIGVDRGVLQPLVASRPMDQKIITMTPEERRRLRRLSKSVSRKKKGSKNRARAQRRLNLARLRLRRRVDDSIHKATTHLAKNHGLVAVEELDVRSMTASAAGTVEAPGKQVAQKRGLNREILSRKWGEIGRQLGYKCPWYGSRLVQVPPHYSSQECAECGHTAAQNRESQSLFRCVRCGHEDHADHNAARIIEKRGILLAAGHAVTACGEDVRRRLGHAASVKQEPTRKARKRAV